MRPWGISEEGFLGPNFKPFATGGDPNAARFEVEGVVARGITDDRQKARRELLGKMDTMASTMAGHPGVIAAKEAKEQAYELILAESLHIELAPHGVDVLADELAAELAHHSLGYLVVSVGPDINDLIVLLTRGNQTIGILALNIHNRFFRLTKGFFLRKGNKHIINGDRNSRPGGKLVPHIFQAVSKDDCILGTGMAIGMVNDHTVDYFRYTEVNVTS